MTTDTLDRQRDILDVAIPTAEDHLDLHRKYCRAVISARAPEFRPAEIADAFGAEFSARAENDPTESIWLEISERVLDAVEALEERLDRLERTINGGTDDDDDERDRRQA
jgi:hypothetical protein